MKTHSLFPILITAILLLPVMLVCNPDIGIQKNEGKQIYSFSDTWPDSTNKSTMNTPHGFGIYKGDPGGTSPIITEGETIRYDDGTNLTAVGSSGGEVYAAAYFPASTMGQYAGMELTQVEIYIALNPFSATLQIYGSGTSTAPGGLIYTQAITTAANSWIMIDLSNPVSITGDDLWIGYKATHDPGLYPAGVDADPAIAGFGDMASEDGINWIALSDYGMDYNWNIAGYLDEGGVLCPTVDAGTDATICCGDNYTFSDAAASNYSSLQWFTTIGAGFFDDENAMNPTYFPSSIDCIMGSVEICVAVYPIFPCTIAAEDCMILAFQDIPTVFAGADATINCEDVYYIEDALATNYSGLQWSTDGDGVFIDETVQNPGYLPGFGDCANCSVELCLNAYPINPCVVSLMDCIELHIITEPPSTEPLGNGTSDDPHLIASLENLYWMAVQTNAGNTFVGKFFLQTADIDASETQSWFCGLGWEPIGTVNEPFSGSYDGGCNTIESLFIDRPNESYLGLFGVTDEAEIKELRLLNFNILGNKLVGALAGKISNSTSISYAQAENVQIYLSDNYSGGLVGQAILSSIYRCSSSGQLSKGGANHANWIGGLVGAISNSTLVEECYSLTNLNSSINNIYAGLVGVIWSGGEILNCYARGAVVGTWAIAGGFVGDFGDGSVNNCYSTGLVSAPSLYVGGFVGRKYPEASYNNNFWDIETSGQSTSLCVTGKTTAEMKAESTFTDAGWDFDNVWAVDGFTNDGYPLLKWQLAPVVFAGEDATISSNNSYYLNGVAVNYSSLLWTTSGDGTISNPEILNPEYSLGEMDTINGQVTLCLTAYPLDQCMDSVTDCMTLTIEEAPYLYPGPDDTICVEGGKYLQKEGAYYQLYGSTNLDPDEYDWTTDGDGYFDDPFLLDPWYCWGVLDILNGSVTLTISKYPPKGNSKELSDSMVLTLQSPPTVYAGADTLFCCGDSYTIADALASHYSWLQWSTNGDGAFDDETLQNPNYTFGPGDCENDSVVLCIVAYPIDPCTVAAEDCMTIYLQNPPIADAGPDQTYCCQSYNLAYAYAINHASLLWTSSGDGTFIDSTILHADYYPGPIDRNYGDVELCLTAYPVYPCEDTITDCMILTIYPYPQVTLGPDTAICACEPFILSQAVALHYSALLWTSSGTGTFSQNDILDPVYYPSDYDCDSIGSVELCLYADGIPPCAMFASDCIIITFYPLPEMHCRNDFLVCIDESIFVLSGCTPIGGTYSGLGVINNHFKAETAGVGSHTITYVYTDEHGCTDSFTFAITVEALPIVYAGDDATICEGDSYPILDANINGEYETFFWYSFGDGSFDNYGEIHPTYSPGTEDIESGDAELLLIVFTNDPYMYYVGDVMTLNIRRKPAANAGADISIGCDASVQLIGSAQNYASLFWFTTNGSGFFTNQGTSTPQYFPSEEDQNMGYVNICLRAYGFPPCDSVDDCMTLNIDCKEECVDPVFFWVKQAGGVSYDKGNAVTADAEGNVYTTGYFKGAVNFGSIALVSTRNSSDIFLSKQNSDGEFLWVRQLDGGIPEATGIESGNAIAIGTSGNIYITGKIYASIPGFGLDLSCFVAKYNPVGNIIGFKTSPWLTSYSRSEGLGIALGDNETVHITGRWQHWEAKELSGVLEDGLENSRDSWGEIFITKMDNILSLVWHKLYSGDNADAGRGIAVNSDGDIFITGDFSSSTLTIPTTTTPIELENTGSGSRDIVIAKHDGTTGLAEWAIKSIICSTGDDFGNDLALDLAGYAYIAGTKASNIIAEKYSTLGNLEWSKQMESQPGSWGEGISITIGSVIQQLGGERHIFITGGFEGTVDFDPDGEFGSITAFNTDMFILKLNTAFGEFVDVLINESLVAYGIIPGLHSIAVGQGGCLHTTGAFIFADFDPDNPPILPPPYPPNSPTLLCTGNSDNYDIFIQKLCCCCMDSTDFLARVAQGWDITINEENCSVTVSADQFNDSCHFIWTAEPDWGDGSGGIMYLEPEIPANGTWTHYYSHLGTYTISAWLVEMDQYGNICWEQDMDTTIVICCDEPPPISIRDTAFCFNQTAAYIPLNYEGNYCDVNKVKWFIRKCGELDWDTYQDTYGLNPLLFLPNKYEGETCLEIKARVNLNCKECGLKVVQSNVARIDLCRPINIKIDKIDTWQFCGSAPPIHLTSRLFYTPPDEPVCNYSSIIWKHNGVFMASGKKCKTPLLKFEEADSICYTDHVFTVEVTNICGTRSASQTIRIFNHNSDDGILEIDPFEFQPLCFGEDLTLKYTAKCTGDPPLWKWYSTTIDPPVPDDYLPIPNAGTRNPLYNTNRLYQTTWYRVEKRNGVCPLQYADLRVEVKDSLAITNFSLTSDPCSEIAAMELAFTPPSVEQPCIYEVTFYKDGLQLYSIFSSVSSVSFTWVSPGNAAGKYFATVRDTCCWQLAKSTIKTITPACVPVLSGPCYRCFDDTTDIQLSVSMIIPPNKPCPYTYNCTYQWFLDGELIPDATASEYSSPDAGTFRVETTCMTEYGPCVRKDSGTVVQCPEPCLPGKYLADNTVSPKALEVINGTPALDSDAETGVGNDFFKVYPNPTTGTFTLELNEISDMPLDTRVYLEIYNMIGNKVLSTEMPAQKQYILSLDKQQQGMYFIRVMMDKRLGTLRIIKR